MAENRALFALVPGLNWNEPKYYSDGTLPITSVITLGRLPVLLFNLYDCRQNLG